MAYTHQPRNNTFLPPPPPPPPKRQQSAKRTPRLVLQYHRNRYSGASAMLDIPVPPKTAPLFRPQPMHRESGYTASVYSERAFDDLYDVTDDERDEVPLKVSESFKKFLSKNDVRRESLPSLVIPSPTAWPTIEKLRSASAIAPKSPELPRLIVQTPLSPAALARVNDAPVTLRVPGAASTPSLDGSLNSDEVASMSPSTPDMRLLARGEGWDMPVQLNAQAMETLQHLSPEFTQELLPIIESPELEAGEMEERGLNIALTDPAAAAARGQTQHEPLLDAELVSAISLPSPGGFLASLTPSTRNAWALPSSIAREEQQQPSTATAETFYDIPWHARSGSRIVEHIVSVDTNDTEGPPTARQNNFTSDDAADAEMIIRPREYEYDDQYEKKLYETAASNKTRTSLWLNAQETYLSALRGNNPANAEISSPRISQETTSTPQGSPSLKSPSTNSSSDFSATKKAVRFAGEPKTPSQESSRIDPLFYHAFQHLAFASRPSDALDLGRIRADALQAQRLYLSSTHHAQLRGSYRLAAPKKPTKDFSHLPAAPNDPNLQHQREAVAQADRERQALTQISLANWYLEGSRLLSGGALIPRTVRECIKAAREAGRSPRVLDLGGIANADFGWALALEERDAKIYTATVRSDSDAEVPSHRGPSNHRGLVVDAPWKLPFRDATFDVVSARSLHALLRTRRGSQSSQSGNAFLHPFGSDLKNSGSEDEWTLTLSEIHRVLRPGGAFHYHLLDAELSSIATSHNATPQPISALQTRSVEFAVALRGLGYDPAAGHRSVTRLAGAGFSRDNVSENWVELPIGGRGGAGPSNVADLTEMVGAVAWERWMLATRGERGLDGFGGALEDARKGARRCGWRVLVGVAKR